MDSYYLDWHSPLYISNHKLPHWHQNGKMQFVTFRLSDSLPRCKLEIFREEKELWLLQHPKPWNHETETEYEEIFANKIDKYLDAEYGRCILRKKSCATLVKEVLEYNNYQSYRLIDYVIMSNHVHVLLVVGDIMLDTIVKNWKSVSAHQINKILLEKQPVWSKNYFDTLVRNKSHYDKIVNYIQQNIQQGGVIWSRRP